MVTKINTWSRLRNNNPKNVSTCHFEAFAVFDRTFFQPCFQLFFWLNHLNCLACIKARGSCVTVACRVMFKIWSCIHCNKGCINNFWLSDFENNISLRNAQLLRVTSSITTNYFLIFLDKSVMQQKTYSKSVYSFWRTHQNWSFYFLSLCRNVCFLLSLMLIRDQESPDGTHREHLENCSNCSSWKCQIRPTASGQLDNH